MTKPEVVCKVAEQVKEVVQNTQMQVMFQFPCPVYAIERKDFLESVSQVSEEHLAEARKKRDLNEIYPVVMTGNYFDDPRVNDFVEFVGTTAWDILAEQGYAMQDKGIAFTEMWTQEHYKHSAMEQHVHAGSHIVGFYFLEVPENSSLLLFHDPRAGKVMSDLPEADISKITIASQIINFTPRPGLLMFSNAWLAHSFSRHASDKPIKFVHFNLRAHVGTPQDTTAPTRVPAAEVV